MPCWPISTRRAARCEQAVGHEGTRAAMKHGAFCQRPYQRAARQPRNPACERLDDSSRCTQTARREKRLRSLSAATPLTCITGKPVAQGYSQQPAPMRETFCCANGHQRRWQRAGDCGYLHADELLIAGRLKDVTIVIGLNYYLQNIEHCVMNSREDYSGCRGAAFQPEGETHLIVVQKVARRWRRALDIGSLAEWVSQRIADACGLTLHAMSAAAPSRIPLTDSGTIQRRLTRSQWAAAQSVLAMWTSPVLNSTSAAVGVSPVRGSASVVAEASPALNGAPAAIAMSSVLSAMFAASVFSDAFSNVAASAHAPLHERLRNKQAAYLAVAPDALRGDLPSTCLGVISPHSITLAACFGITIDTAWFYDDPTPDALSQAIAQQTSGIAPALRPAVCQTLDALLAQIASLDDDSVAARLNKTHKT